MMGRKGWNNSGVKRRRMAGFLLMLTGVLTVIGLLAGRMHPLVKRLAESKAESVTLKIINDRVAELLANEDVSYESLVNIGYNAQGEITYIGADMVKLNGFKSRISSKIQESFDSYDFGTINVPLGTLMGGDYFIGRGPSFRFRVDMSCSVACSFTNVFDDAGINQTRHQILLEVTGTTFAIAPWCKTSSSVTTNFIIAETVIVGLVPEYYTRVERSEDAAQDINDYGYDIN